MSEAPPLLLNEIGRVRNDRFNNPVARTFVFDAIDDRPGFVATYISHQGKAVLYDAAPITEFRRSRIPRGTPHVAVTESGEEWNMTREGCGCGNPIKRVTWTQVLKDWENGTVGLVNQQEGEPAAAQA